MADTLTSSVDIDALLSDRSAFDSFVYTPLREAVAELERRRADPRLASYVARSLPAGIPDIMRGRKSMVLFRHVATSNFEFGRFAERAEALPELQPLILEFTEDKFTNRNEGKYFLGRLRFHKDRNRNGEPIVEHVVIIDFNVSNNQPIAALTTCWGQPLVAFHHELFQLAYPQLGGSVFDLSDWLRAIGPMARDFYKAFLTLFVRDSILFENFLLDAKELSFTREVVLPAIIQIADECGAKPLIVALEPTEGEGDRYWLSHPYALKRFVEEKLEHSRVSG